MENIVYDYHSMDNIAMQGFSVHKYYFLSLNYSFASMGLKVACTQGSYRSVARFQYSNFVIYVPVLQMSI